MTTFLSGIQSSGRQHLGNYFGAIKQHIDGTATPGDHFYFIADYHALTTSRDPEELRGLVQETAITYLALGLDPEKCSLFRQTDVPEVHEIAWLLSCVTGMGLLERAHSYKDKVGNGIKPNVGLFTYPVLMAADILAYDSDVVPVGKDQIQHVEMTQDMAGYFNNTYGKHTPDGYAFVRPEYRMAASELFQKVPGVDGQKMSKSYGNSIWIFESGKKLKKAIGRVPTDSREPSEPKNPDELVLFDFLALFLEAKELEDWKERVRKGGPDAPGYGHLKMRVVEAMEEYFAPARKRREELIANPAEVEAALQRGAATARARAQMVRDRAMRACGLK
ncbi:MAG: tryptophan--tRNA ligase [Planctomycetota bacterium]|nr:tryptophan--tRNA ligase [Planctomycetota bacterium]MDG2143478.1 tryptophan--tRNA ligase [Planctomycetota bacterium]